MLARPSHPAPSLGFGFLLRGRCLHIINPPAPIPLAPVYVLPTAITSFPTVIPPLSPPSHCHHVIPHGHSPSITSFPLPSRHSPSITSFPPPSRHSPRSFPLYHLLPTATTSFPTVIPPLSHPSHCHHVIPIAITSFPRRRESSDASIGKPSAMYEPSLGASGFARAREAMGKLR